MNVKISPSDHRVFVKEAQRQQLPAYLIVEQAVRIAADLLRQGQHIPVRRAPAPAPWQASQQR